MVLNLLPDLANTVPSHLTSYWAKNYTQNIYKLGEYSSGFPYLELSRILFSVYFQIGQIQFLVTLPRIKLNVVLSLLKDQANTVPDYFTSDWAKYNSQSTSRLGKHCSWLPHFRLSRTELSAYLQIKQIEFLVTLPQIVLNIVLSLFPDRTNTIPGKLTSDWVEYNCQYTSISDK